MTCYKLWHILYYISQHTAENFSKNNNILSYIVYDFGRVYYNIWNWQYLQYLNVIKNKLFPYMEYFVNALLLMQNIL